jgi:hypothetical protein
VNRVQLFNTANIAMTHVMHDDFCVHRWEITDINGNRFEIDCFHSHTNNLVFEPRAILDYRTKEQANEDE